MQLEHTEDFVNEIIANITVLPNWWVAVASGEVDGAFFVNKFGENSAVTASTATIWDAGGLYQYISSATTLDVVSDDANDTLLGTGARTIRLYGLDANYEEIEEDIEMAGLTPVVTINSFIRIFRMRVLTGGSTGGAIGIIQAKDGATVQAQIVDGNNQTLMAMYTIPAGKTGFLMKGKSSSGKGKDVTGSFYARPFGGVFNLNHRFYQYQNSYEFEFNPGIVALPEKTDIEVRALADISTPVSAAFILLVVDNPT